MDKPKFALMTGWINIAKTICIYLTHRKFRGEYRFRQFILSLINAHYIRVSYLERGFIWINPNEHIGSNIFWNGAYDLQTIHVIQEFMKSGYVFIDIGANIGSHLLGAAFGRKEDLGVTQLRKDRSMGWIGSDGWRRE